MRNPYAAYVNTQIETATPESLITMLYDGAIRFCGQAKQALGAGDLSSANNFLGRAQAILAELASCLDMQRGGDIAKNLSALYDYMYRRLVEANVKKDAAIIDEVSGMIADLRNTWVEAARRYREQRGTGAYATGTLGASGRG